MKISITNNSNKECNFSYSEIVHFKIALAGLKKTRDSLIEARDMVVYQSNKNNTQEKSKQSLEELNLDIENINNSISRIEMWIN